MYTEEQIAILDIPSEEKIEEIAIRKMKTIQPVCDELASGYGGNLDCPCDLNSPDPEYPGSEPQCHCLIMNISLNT